MKQFIVGIALATLVACGDQSREVIKREPDCPVIVTSRSIPYDAVDAIVRSKGIVSIRELEDGLFETATWDTSLLEDDERWDEIVSYNAGCLADEETNR